MNRPKQNEYVEYYHQYVRLVSNGDVIEILDRQIEETLQYLTTVDEEKANFRYAPGKWRIKEVIGHVVDVERVFAYRALMFARKDSGPLHSIDQDELVLGANFTARTLADICEEFHYLRKSNIILFRSFDEKTSMQKGIASGFEFTVRAIPYIIAGHELHHLKVIKERYFQRQHS